MESNKKIIFFIISIVMLSQPAFARKNEPAANTTSSTSKITPEKTSEKINGSYSDYENILKTLTNQSVARLAAMRNQLPFASIREAVQLGKALSQLNDGHDEAAASLLHDTNKNSLLADYANYFEATALMHQKKYDKALALLPNTNNPANKIQLEAFWLRMRLLADTKNTQALAQSITAIKRQRTQDKWMTIKGEYYLGLGDWHAGNQALAIKHFVNVLVENPGTEYDKKIFNLVQEKGISQKQILSEALWNLRAQKLISSGYPHKALEIWRDFYSRDKSYAERVAYGTFKARLYSKAAQLYSDLLASGQNQSSEVQILQKIAQSYSRYDNFDAAIEANKKILQKFPGTSAASESDFKLGFLYFDAGQYEKAAQYLEKFMTRGTPSQKDNAHWYRFWSFYLTQRYDQALSELAAFPQTKSRDKEWAQLSTYWRARVLEKLGKNDEAKKIYLSLAEKYPQGYYGLLARQRIMQKKLTEKTLISLQCLRSVPACKEKNNSNPVELKKIKMDTAMQRAVLLSLLGLDDFAYAETQQSATSKSISDYNNALAVQLAGNFNRGLTIQQTAINGGLPGADPLSGFRIAYPLAYEKYVTPAAALWNLDDKLAYAIMRQESAFKPEVESFAFAFGLMQIIPPTADSIAKRLDFTAFHPTQLNKPLINIFFGTHYLSRLMQRFNNNIIYTIAAYNAGPKAVERWNSHKTQLSPDEFIELIPYQETRTYVKRVLVNYLVYQKIYP